MKALQYLINGKGDQVAAGTPGRIAQARIDLDKLPAGRNDRAGSIDGAAGLQTKLRGSFLQGVWQLLHPSLDPLEKLSALIIWISTDVSRSR